jgi:hypothetical protein
VALLELQNRLELTKEDRFDLFAVWGQRQLKDTSPRGVIERPHRIDRPIHKTVSLIMGIFVIIKNVGHGIS